MQSEQQIKQPKTPEIAPHGESSESNAATPKRGGKRPGAGRKANLAKVLLKGVSRTTILTAVENVDVGAIIIGLLKSKREQTRIEALHFSCIVLKRDRQRSCGRRSGSPHEVSLGVDLHPVLPEGGVTTVERKLAQIRHGETPLANRVRHIE